MELAALRERFPALERSMLAWRALARRQTVWLAPNDAQLTLAWCQGRVWEQRCVPLPEDVCRDGLPLQRDALADFLADWLLENGLPPPVVDLVLLLPLQCCHWRLVVPPDAQAPISTEALRSLQPDLGWSLPLPELVLALESSGLPSGSQLLVGAERLLFQSWLAVIEAADLRLERVDGLLPAARRGLLARCEAEGMPLSGDLAWLLQQGSAWRLLVLRDGWPELERVFSSADALRSDLEALLLAWERHAGASSPAMRCWITAPAEARQQLQGGLGGRWAEEAGGARFASLESLALPDPGSEAEAPPPGLDLLEERRRELGLAASVAGVGAGSGAPPARALLLQGSLWGGGLVLASLLLLALMGWQEGQQAQQLAQLMPVEQRVTRAESRLRRLRATTMALRKNNTRLAEQLVAVPSGSALLEQLRRVTPAGVQLQSLRVQGNAIELSGEAQASLDPGPLERINALVLALAALPISESDGVKVVKVTRSGDDGGPVQAVTFSLTWGLDPAARPSLATLKALGADGLARRFQLLQQAGVAL
ncbi:hypothetical protein SynWH8101_2686 [Synechococcus sp. WH 8101]|uniref:PilN domain-containing protein n=1 Tax=Synechococcus sp. WH 8101 TaxID=59932 RepID=UPI00102488D3|nr:PilN domain-containing protein [Synechococcus sp. WH 8101]QBE70252.1 hypothetical protein SynWH8101_2686 [Synechococcus sp. WH 8101]QNI46524.1 fimbrial assembly family protein [Synechococcus sp. WH 8101]